MKDVWTYAGVRSPHRFQQPVIKYSSLYHFFKMSPFLLFPGLTMKGYQFADN